MSQAQNLDGGPFLPTAGGTMSGDIDFSSKKALNLNQVTFENVQFISATTTQNFGKIQFQFGSFRLSGIKDALARISIGYPTAINDATTKGYVDQSIQTAISDTWAKAY